MIRFMKSLNNISRSQGIYRTARLSCTGAGELSPCHYSLALAICRAPGRSQDELARDLCLNKSTVTRSLAQLEERGFVAREVSGEDKRKIVVTPTDKLLSVHPELLSVTREWSELITDGIAEEELEIFASVLRKLEERARTAAEEVAK